MANQERIVALEARIAALEGRLAALESRKTNPGPTTYGPIVEDQFPNKWVCWLDGKAHSFQLPSYEVVSRADLAKTQRRAGP